MNILYLGDSITAGYGVPADRSFVAISSGETDSVALNRGVCGDTLWGMDFRLGRIHEPYGLLFIMGGINDLLKEKDNIADDLAALLSDAEKHDCPVICATLYPLDGELAYRHWDASVNYDDADIRREAFNRSIVAQAEKRGFAIADFDKTFRSLSPEDQRAFYLDGIHPSEKGHLFLAHALLPILKKLI